MNVSLFTEITDTYIHNYIHTYIQTYMLSTLIHTLPSCMHYIKQNDTVPTFSTAPPDNCKDTNIHTCKAHSYILYHLACTILSRTILYLPSPQPHLTTARIPTDCKYNDTVPTFSTAPPDSCKDNN